MNDSVSGGEDERMRSYLPAGLPLPAPRPDGADREYWELARQHHLGVQRCDDCGRAQFPPEIVCKSCQSSSLRWTAVPPRGQLYSFTRVWHPVHPALADAVPYLVGVVEIEPGVRMIGNIIGDPLIEPAFGAPVEAAFEDHDDVTLIQWQLIDNPRH